MGKTKNKKDKTTSSGQDNINKKEAKEMAKEAEKALEEEKQEETKESTGKASENKKSAENKEKAGEQKKEEKAEREEAKEEKKEAAEEKASEEKAPEKEEKKGFFGKKKPDPLKEKIEELEDKVKRQMAEFENFRKRTDKEKTEMFSLGAKSVIEKLLPTVDNFERGLAGAPQGDAFAEGMEKIYKKLLTDLEELGVAPIEAEGKPFDPNFHNAVMQDPEGDCESGTITRELQKGYTYKGSVVRHSMVAVKE